MPSSPPPLAAPIARRLSVSAGIGGEDGLISTVLPEDLLVEILAERLMVSNLLKLEVTVGHLNSELTMKGQLCSRYHFI